MNKWNKVAILGVVIATGAGVAMAAGLQGTAHDFSAAGNSSWNTHAAISNRMEVCYPCHTPHGGNNDAGLLWNHQLSSLSKLIYTNSLSASTGNLNPNGKSMMCLGCHDGVTGLDAYAGVTNGSINMATFSPDAAIGPDLGNDHPIGVDMFANTNNASWPSYIKVSSGRYSITSQWGSVSLELSADGTKAMIGCGTCHKAHDNDNGYFMRMDNTGSHMCITCHGTKWDGQRQH